MKNNSFLDTISNANNIYNESDSDKKKSVHDVNDSHLQSTVTDMLVENLANSEKLVPEEERWHFTKDQKASFAKSKSRETVVDEDDNLANFIDDANSKNNHNSKEQIFHTTNSHDNNDNNDNKISDKDEMSQNDLMLQRLDMLRKLGELANNGVKLSQNYNMNSDYNTMKYEYELHTSIRSKQNGINWMSSMMMNCIYGIEMLNETYDPFSLKLKGWSEQINADQSNYYEVFGELYEKYNKPGKNMAPELKLLLLVSGSAIKYHLGNAVMSTFMSNNVASKLSDNPQLVEQLRQQAVADKIKQQSTKQNENLNTMMNKEHTLASQKMADLQMLKQKELEYLKMQQETIKQQEQYEQLKAKLHTPVIQQQQHAIQMPQHNNIIRSEPQQYEMSMPHTNNNINIDMHNQMELLRQQQIFEQQKVFVEQQKKLVHQNTLPEKISTSNVSYNPNLDNIIRNNLNKIKENDSISSNDNKSNLINMGIYDADTHSSISIGSSKRKNKKKSNGLSLNI